MDDFVNICKNGSLAEVRDFIIRHRYGISIWTRLACQTDRLDVIKLLVMEEDKDHLLGFICFDNSKAFDILHFMYIKTSFRKLKLSKILFTYNLSFNKILKIYSQEYLKGDMNLKNWTIKFYVNPFT